MIKQIVGMWWGVVIALLLVSQPTYSQAQQAEHRYEPEIKAFEETDRQTPPPANAILFTGSSSIRLWENLPAYFPGRMVLNRGFGGSELSDVRYYADRVILSYKPKQVVLYAGENDIATGKQTAQQTYDRLVNLFRYIRRNLPKARFTYISIKPGPSRRQYRATVDEANGLIRRFLARQRNTDFVDITPVMLQVNGQPKGELFKPDSLHMNVKGYELWGGVLQPFVK